MKKTDSFASKFFSKFSLRAILLPMFFALVFAGTLAVNNSRVFADTVNLLPNPAFTADPANTAVPTGWKFSTFGNNNAVSGYPAVGPDASTIGLKTSISSYTDGFADWFTDPIAVTAGATYHYSDTYTSDSEGVVEAQYTITDPNTGATSQAYVDLLTISSTNGSWVNASIDFVAPANATQLVVFHLIRSVGSLTITQPSLTKIADPVAQDASNLLPNPSFSSDPFFPNSPLGWKYSTYGTSVSATTYPAPGPDANTKALKTTVTSFTNGFVDWFTDPVTITPYGTYHYSEKYQADTDGVIEAQFIVTDPATGAATTTYSDLAYTSSTNGSWADASFDFIIPTNATSMRVFHLIRSVGSLSIASPKLTKVADPEFFPHGMVTLTFDDGNQTNYDRVFPALKDAGLKGTFYIISGSMQEAENIGTSTGDINNDYMTASEVWDLNVAGNEIGGHTVNHCNLATGLCPDAEVANSADPLSAQDEITTSKTVLKDTGFLPVDTFAYPYGGYNQNIKNLVSNAGFIGARTVDRGFNLPNSDRYGLRIQYINASTTSAADFNNIVKPWIDQAAKDHVWLILLMHQVETPDQVAVTHDPDATSPEMLNSIVSYLKTNNIPVVTMHEGICMMDGMQNDPRCSAPTVPTGSYHTPTHDWHDYDYNYFDDEDYICDITDNNSGWLGSYYNYSSTTVGMELPVDQWGTTYGDPMSDKADFTAPWYDNQFGRFARVDKTLTFGNNFFPFDAYPEEITQGHDYHFGVHWSAEIVATTTGDYAYTLTSDDDAWIYVDGELVVDNSGLHPAKTMTGTIPLTAGSQIVDIYFAERHTNESNFSFEFADKNLNILAYSPIDCGCGDATNTAPVITLKGANPLDVTQGTTYVDPGATAYDKEDGDITSDIVVTNTVNTNVLGTYTVTYNVKDKEGLAATPVTRTVHVIPGQVTPSTCLAPDALGGSTHVTFGSSWDGDAFSLQNILNNAGYSINTVNDQLNYQVFTPNADNTTLTVKAIAHVSAHDEVFGYFRVGSSVFNPIYKTANIAGYESVPLKAAGESLSVNLTGREGIVFAIFDSNDGTFRYTKGVMNNPSSDTFSVVYSGSSSAEKYVIGFEDLSSVRAGGSDFDYNDTVLEVYASNCFNNVNHPPVITLLGANPITIEVGTAFTDPGATAWDPEEHDITSRIVKTGTVNTAVVGTYTITYNVSDSQGLAATPVTRTVNVIPAGGGGGNTGTITFCKIYADNQNVIASTSAGLPAGIFSINLATSTVFGSTTVQTITWNTSAFALNQKFILNTNDAQCVTVNNLPYGTYYYSQETGVTGQWNAPKYNDQYSQPVNNVFDFFPYSGELFTATTTDDASRNMNADGQIILDSFNHNRTLVVLNTYNPGTTTCTTCGGGSPTANLGVTKSVDKANANVGETVTYTITVHNAGPANATNVVLTEAIPAQFNLVSTSTTSGTFSTTTNVWTIGSLPNGSTTTLTLIGTVKTGTEGQKMTNSVSVTGSETDNDTSDNTKTVDTNINGGACTSCGGGGGTPTANLAVTKSVDKSTANVGDTVTYTITVSNAGPANATGVSLSEAFPSLLDFVSATTTSGSYSTTTNVWTIGDLPYASSTTLTLVGTIKSTAAGQKITNSVTVSGTPSDNDNSNNTSTVDTNVNGGGGGGGGGCTNCGGGGGGGNGPIVGSFGGSNGPIVEGTSTCYYLHDYLKKGWNNNPSEVLKLQVFLRDLEGYTDVPVNGIYDDATIKYLDMFQWRYKDDILTPWGHTAPTGFTYILTKKKVNEIYCKMAFPVTPEQQIEIDTFRNFLLHLQQNGISSPTGYYGNPEDYSNSIGTSTDVGVATSTSTSGQSTLAGVSSTTAGIASKMTANVLSAGKKLGRLLAAIFTWPFSGLWGKLFHGAEACVTGVGAFGWLNIILLIIIAIISYFWYREYRNNKRIDDINKDIDLNK